MENVLRHDREKIYMNILIQCCFDRLIGLDVLYCVAYTIPFQDKKSVYSLFFPAIVINAHLW
jgi:hypothetical protein